MGQIRASRAKVAPLGALAALIAVAGVAVLVTQPSTAASPAVLDVLEPDVEARVDGQSRFSKARSGDSVMEGSVIRTDRTGVAAVAYEDGSLTRIGPASTYELVTLRTEEGRREIIGKLDTGQTFHRVSKVTGSASRFEVQTSDAVAAVRGTEFSVQCVVLDICEFGVTEGVVTVRADDGREVDVTAGHRVTVDGEGRLGELKLLSATDPWIARNAVETSPAASPPPPARRSGSAAAAASEPEEEPQFRSWGGFAAPTPSSDSEEDEAAPSDDDSAAADEEDGADEDGGAEDESPSAGSAGSSEGTAEETTTSTTSEPTTTTTTEETTTSTNAPPESTTTTTTAGEPTTTTTTRDDQTTTTTRDDETTTTTTSGDATTTTSGDRQSTTTTTSDETPTTPTSEGSTTTTAPCPDGEEHVEGKGCRPECPHDRERDEHGDCRRECPPGENGGDCAAAASAGSGSAQSKGAMPFLWVFSFLFGGTVLASRAPQGWEN